MSKRYLIDISEISNGQGASVYGGHIKAYSFYKTDALVWLEKIMLELESCIGCRSFTIYRIGDGELRFTFGLKVNWKNDTLRSLLRYLKYEIFKRPWKTSWGESYAANEISDLRNVLRRHLINISKTGKLAIYWNENGLNAFTEYNASLLAKFRSIGIELNQDNYVPFHFPQAIIAHYGRRLFQNRDILIVSGMDNDEANMLKHNVKLLGASSCDILRCSKTSSLVDGVDVRFINRVPDLVLIAAGIGSARIIQDLSTLSRPLIDIGSYVHVLSGRDRECHAGFFLNCK